MSKFRKIAAGPKAPGEVGLLEKILSPENQKAISNIFGIDTLENLFSEKSVKRNLPYLIGLLMQGSEKDRYSPDAFMNVIKSQDAEGGYDKMSPELIKQFENFKNNPPSNLKDFITDKPVTLENRNIPESSERYKSMREKLSNNNNKFIKTSAMSTKEELEKVIPDWTIDDVITKMAKVANNNSLSSVEKQKNMIAILNQYENEISPLRSYLSKNGIERK